MPADALNYFYLAKELNQILAGGRIDKITMPEADEIVLNIRAGGANHNLLISASANMPRIHITNHQLANPAIAPAFLMHLRKHISGAGVIGVSLMPFERVIQINLRSKNEMGFSENKTLVAEIMGKCSNIILVNDNGIISECIKHITLDTSSKRQVLSGLPYLPPPAQNKIEPTNEAKITAVLEAFAGGRIDNYLLSSVSGLAPATITQLVFSVFGELSAPKITSENIAKIVTKLAQLYNQDATKACVYKYSSGKSDFAFMPYDYGTNSMIFYDSLNIAMENFYYRADKEKRLNEKAHSLVSALKNAITRTEKKLKLFNEKKAEAQDLNDDRLCGELITANIYKIKQGLKSVDLQNYYTSPMQIVTVVLDENKTPQFNAQRYFKKYSKKKKTLENLTQQIFTAENDLDYYNSILESFRQFDTIAEMDEIALEMANAGLISAPAQKKGAKQPPATPPAKIIVDGYTIIYGRNNVQNDRITKSAKPTDLWLHAKLIHGAHVIIENSTSNLPPENIIQKAAEIAALNSKAFESDNIPVDYTFAKYVSKPKGSPLGKVVYTNQRTLYVKRVADSPKT